MPDAKPENTADWKASLLIVGLGAVPRLVLLVESVLRSELRVPVLDGLKYHMLATRPGLDPMLFEQSPLYPIIVKGLYLLSGDTILFVQGFQLLLGLMTCFVVHRLALRFARPEAAFAATCLMAFYGPALVYELRLVGVTLAMFWMALLLFSYIKLSDKPVVGWAITAGIVSVAALLTRPNFLPLILIAPVWLLWQFKRKRDQFFGRRCIATLSALVSAAFLGLLVAALLSVSVTGSANLLPRYSGLNLYMGNQPDSPQLEATRPGPAWDRLRNLYNDQGPAAQSRAYKQKVWTFFRDAPAGFTVNSGRKVLELFASREVPNTIDLYFYREHSLVLRGLLWRIGRWGFPAGLILPLAFIGLLAWWRGRLPGIVPLALISYAGTIVAAHVSARYRMPMLPILAVLAACGIDYIANSIRRKDRSVSAAAAGIALLVSIIGVLAPIHPREKLNYALEFEIYRGAQQAERGQLMDALRTFESILEERPEHPTAMIQRSHVLLSMGRVHETREQLEELLRLYPDYVQGHLLMARVMEISADAPAVRSHLERAFAINRAFAETILSRQGR